MPRSLGANLLPGFKTALLVLITLLLSACALFRTPEPGIGKAIAWNKLEGWDKDNHSEAWVALLHSCKVLDKKPEWQPICTTARGNPNPSDEAARTFFERWFSPHPVFASGGKSSGLITGYYEPLLFGSRSKDQRFRYPLYGRPDSLLIIDLGDRFTELKNKRLRGRLVGNKVISFYSRAEIDDNERLLESNELLWLDDKDALFFLHIQGSGRVQLPDGSVVGVGYADQNGHVYRSIGKVLVEKGELLLEEVTLFTIREWLRNHPDQAQDLLNQNPSYIFFVLRDDPGEGPVGSLNVPLTPQRSIAIDPKLVNLGVPIWLSTHYPGQPEQSMNRLVFAQDTGGAIKGNVRADVFWGHDVNAERAAGTMKSPGSLFVLLPKTAVNQE